MSSARYYGIIHNPTTSLKNYKNSCATTLLSPFLPTSGNASSSYCLWNKWYAVEIRQRVAFPECFPWLSTDNLVLRLTVMDFLKCGLQFHPCKCTTSYPSLYPWASWLLTSFSDYAGRWFKRPALQVLLADVSFQLLWACPRSMIVGSNSKDMFSSIRNLKHHPK